MINQRYLIEFIQSKRDKSTTNKKKHLQQGGLNNDEELGSLNLLCIDFAIGIGNCSDSVVIFLFFIGSIC